MKILFSPQRSDNSINYTFNDEIITATIDNITDVFDFSAMPNGKLDSIETALPVNPIISAERINGELKVQLLYFHSADATQEELFPVWQEI